MRRLGARGRGEQRVDARAASFLPAAPLPPLLALACKARCKAPRARLPEPHNPETQTKTLSLNTTHTTTTAHATAQPTRPRTSKQAISRLTRGNAPLPMEPAPRLTLVGFQSSVREARLMRRDCSSRSLLSESLVVAAHSPPSLASPVGHHPGLASPLSRGSSSSASDEDAMSAGDGSFSYDDGACRRSSVDSSSVGTSSSPVAICYDRRCAAARCAMLCSGRIGGASGRGISRAVRRGAWG